MPRSSASVTGRLTAHASTRYWWISETAIEPSPTALATRLNERARTSPATNTPGTRRLEQVRLALERPARALDVGPGEDEPALVARDHAVEPVRARRGADEDEAGVGRELGLGALGRAHAQAAESPALPLRGDGRALRAHGDVRKRLELLDQVARHRALERRAAHEHRDAARRSR